MSHTEHPPIGIGAPVVPPARTAGHAGPPAPTAPLSADRPLDIGVLRHPTEASRFALALVASTLTVAVAAFVLVSLGRATQLLLALLVIVVVLALLWLLLQLWRVRLLADGVRVSAESLPEVQDALDTVRRRLGYQGRLDVFVVDKVSRVMAAEAPPVTLTSYFGVRVLVAEGSALGDLSDDRECRQLVFMLATYVGALKARHTQWSPLLLALAMSGLPKVVFLFVYPWYRATVYTGDRIAYACCGDLDVSLQAVYRALIGREVAPHLRAAGLVGQALAVRRTTVLRLSQLLRPEPHATNRYLDLLSFAAGREPAVFETFRSGLGPAPSEVDGVLARLGRRRPLALAAPAGVLLSALLLVAGVAAGLGAQDSDAARAIAVAFGGGAGDTGPDGPGPAAPGADTVVPGPEPVVPDEGPSPAEVLIGLVPADLRQTCVESSAGLDRGLVTAVDCSAAATSGPAQVSYYAYAGTAQMQAAFDALAGDLPEGDCSTGNVRGTWTHLDLERGPLACYVSQAGRATALWGDDDAAVLALAHDSTLSTAEIFAWWQQHALLAQ